MKETIPHFKYQLANPSSKQFGSIEVNGEVIHKVENLDDFYEFFGYTQDTRKAGVLPEEFIWAEYINATEVDFTACMQMHIIEYLARHSTSFRERYGDSCERWMEAHAKIRTERGIKCAACRMEPFCAK